MKENKKPQAVYAPGELDRTRKNLGNLDSEEAQRISKILGGEIGVEKPGNQEENDKARKVPGKTTYLKRTPANSGSSSGNEKLLSLQSLSGVKSVSVPQLPHLANKERIAMEKLLSNKKYRIKNGYSFISAFLGFNDSNEKVSADFILNTLNDYLGHIQKFLSSSKKILSSSANPFQEKVETIQAPLYRVFRLLEQWDIEPLSTLLLQFQKTPREITIVRMIPFVRGLFIPLVKLYFLGEKHFTTIFKTAYQEIAETAPTSMREGLLQLTKDVIAQWYYIYGQVIPGMYPLLMRMCSSECLSMQDFFSKKISRIFTFLLITKFDIIMPVSEVSAGKPIEKDVEEIVDKNTESENIANQIPDSVKKGLSLLDRLFPESGWLSLDTYPDLYPYFQPILLFRDGFNLLSPENPLQVTVILMRIIEELFYACRAISFSFGEECGVPQKEDSLTDIFNEWPFYREDAFEKRYISGLKEYVNQAFAQSDFRKTPYARKMMSNLMWMAKSYFLPNLVFEMLVLDRLHTDFAVKSFPVRIQSLKKIFIYLVQGIESSINRNGGHTGGVVTGIGNPWASYVFAVPNAVSRRLDAILGGKYSHARTNANLLYQTLLIVNVLDWWVNNPMSFAYTRSAMYPYRTKDDESSSPVFSVPTRTDLNDLFIKYLKMRKMEKTGGSPPPIQNIPQESPPPEQTEDS